ncbi:putative enoyl-CoA hydratase [Rhodococcoides trifolii]|uniref:3-hydroxyisobutyryl-CoA hydrolase n=1 Tax=Rhodococcoides trifolii TaxID=908250 RepID=A0A917CWQ9_9NOCA|nr:enoyl-CoA hydratase/isomerase family protein [Rhodococcus trifolii]GGG00954.1 putative enoyl-CoA hydratase [Rhodococcus trifolii]
MTDVVFDVSDGVGTILLNRPKAINALTHDMVREIDAQLIEWESDSAVRVVLLKGAGDRGLCAGGDIVSIYEDARSGGRASADFWRDEYVMNSRIGRYPKPFVAIMDGIVMGGGVGIAAHASVRVVTERSKVGMPEVGIGFVPDVGGTWLLARSPGQTGVHVALTTARMSAADAIATGFADHLVPSELLEEFEKALRTGSVDDAVSGFARTPDDSALMAQREWIDDLYAGDDASDIVNRLRESGIDEAVDAANAVESKSPTSVSVTLRSIRQAERTSSLETVLNQEYRISVACLSSPDLVEGIRAQVIDKDRSPSWAPATLAEVTSGDVDRFFASLGDAELDLAEPDQQ